MAKIFVGGLNWDTTDEAFKNFFAPFGEIEESLIMRHRETGTSRGFGFVTFKDPSSVDQVLKSTDLELDQRKIDCKAAVPKEAIGQPGMGAVQRTKKIFIGGLLPEITESEVKDYFSQFGEVVEAMIMMDRLTNRSRGFAFVTYGSEDSVEKVIAVQSHELGGKAVECKKAVPKQKMPMPGFGGFGKGAYGGKGGYGAPGGRGGKGGYGGYGGYPAYPAPSPYGASVGRGGGYGGYAPPPAAAAAAYGGYGAPPAAADYGRYAGYEAPIADTLAPPAAAYGGYEAAGAAAAYGGYEAAGAAAAYGGYEAAGNLRSTRVERSYHPYR